MKLTILRTDPFMNGTTRVSFFNKINPGFAAANSAVMMELCATLKRSPCRVLRLSFCVQNRPVQKHEYLNSLGRAFRLRRKAEPQQPVMQVPRETKALSDDCLAGEKILK